MSFTFYRMKDWTGTWIYIVNVFKNDNLLERMVFEAIEDAEIYIQTMRQDNPSIIVG